MEYYKIILIRDIKIQKCILLSNVVLIYNIYVYTQTNPVCLCVYQEPILPTCIYVSTHFVHKNNHLSGPQKKLPQKDII